MGLTIFFLGLFKKVVIADGLEESILSIGYCPASWKIQQGLGVSILEAWIDALAYTLRLYFDFSGYSDMAIGLSLLFGIRIPINFASPYKSKSIIDFWRCWHMSLSNFLRDYVYISLGGNRKGEICRYVNIALTMLIGGIWHGAGWTFIIWGALHAFYLCVNHAWRHILGYMGMNFSLSFKRIGFVLSWVFTFVCVVIGWVFFKAPDGASAFKMLQAMFSFDQLKFSLGDFQLLSEFGVDLTKLGILDTNIKLPIIATFAWLFMILLVSMVGPNTQEIVNYHEDRETLEPSSSRFNWRPNTMWAIVIAMLFVISLLCLDRKSTFLYFQF